MPAKHEVHYPSNTKMIKVVLSYHGNKFLEQESTARYCCCPRGAYVPNIRFVCYQQQIHEGIWIQGFHSYQLHNLFLLPQWTTPPNLRFIHLEVAMLQQYASVAMVTRFLV